jgi:hypothetical protein
MTPEQQLELLEKLERRISQAQELATAILNLVPGDMPEIVAEPSPSITELPTTAIPNKRDRSKRYAKWPYNPEQVITMLVDKNPKNGDTASSRKFALYRNGMMVAEYIEAVVKSGQKKGKAISGIRWDLAHGFIKVG